MDVYFCSTVRHVLFSLSRALYEKSTDSIIYISIEQQAFSEGDFDLTVLPENIKCIFLYRSDLKIKLKSSLRGRLTYFLSKLDVKYDNLLNRYVANKCLNLIFNVEFSINDKLFLFNDRNSLAKIFRLLFPTYEVIEDGLATYNGQDLNRLFSLFNRLSDGKRYMGEDSRCQSIYLLDTNKSPSRLSHKVQKINWIDPLSIRTICFPFFGFQPSDFPDNINNIIATQPISFDNITKEMRQIPIYESMINALLKYNKKVYLKIHPRESAEPYRRLKNVVLLPSHLPLELILISQNNKCNVYSIYSSAGMGFENYCKRITLFNDLEAELMNQQLKKITLDISLVKRMFDSKVMRGKNDE